MKIYDDKNDNQLDQSIFTTTKQEEDIKEVPDVNKILVTESLVKVEDNVLTSLNSTLNTIDDVDSFSNRLNNNIKTIFQKEPDVTFKQYFNESIKVAKIVYNIDGTSFEPLPVSLIGGGFETKYDKQLNTLIFNDKDTMDENKLLEVLMMYNNINRNNYPICIRSTKYVRLLPRIVSSMNKFMNDNKSIIRSMYTMFNSNMETKKEQLKTKETL